MKSASTLVLVDDNTLLRKNLADKLKQLGYHILFEADNGEKFIEQLNNHPDPDIVLMDINMTDSKGYDITGWLRRNKPRVKVLALSMHDDEGAIIHMLENGAEGYIRKDTDPAELDAAIGALITKGFYYTEMLSGKLIHTISTMNAAENAAHSKPNLNERETEFLRLAASEMTYKEIADQMKLSPRTIDSYRDSLFEKLELKSRVGLVLYAVKNGIVRM